MIWTIYWVGVVIFWATQYIPYCQLPYGTGVWLAFFWPIAAPVLAYEMIKHEIYMRKICCKQHNIPHCQCNLKEEG